MSNTPPPITVEDTATGVGPLPSPEMEGVNGECSQEEERKEEARRGRRDVVKKSYDSVDHDTYWSLKVTRLALRWQMSRLLAVRVPS